MCMHIVYMRTNVERCDAVVNPCLTAVACHVYILQSSPNEER